MPSVAAAPAPAAVDKVSLAIRDVFQASQEDSVSVGKSVSKFRKIWDFLPETPADPKRKPEQCRDHFFRRFVFYLQLPLAVKERTPFVDRCLEVACR